MLPPTTCEGPAPGSAAIGPLTPVESTSRKSQALRDNVTCRAVGASTYSTTEAWKLPEGWFGATKLIAATEAAWKFPRLADRTRWVPCQSAEPLRALEYDPQKSAPATDCCQFSVTGGLAAPVPRELAAFTS